MKERIGILFVLIFMTFGISAAAQEKTKITSAYAKQMLIGRHMLSLQWISWKEFGRANVTQKQGVLYLKGEQKGRKTNDSLKINGVITEISRYEFKFEGFIITKVSYINDGNPCVREGEMTFAITGKRRYWRLQEMESPCGVETDYVDIYFRR